MLNRFYLNFRVAFVLFIVSISGHQSVFAANNPNIKVLILSAKRYVQLSSSQKMTVGGKTSLKLNPYRLTIHKRNALSVKLQNKYNTTGSIFIKSAAPIRLGRYAYDGMIEIRPHAKGFYLINHVSLETYLEGVIGAEIDTSWHPEALKTQAVIARTYALYQREKRIKHLWHLTNTTRDQVYKGDRSFDLAGVKAIRSTQGIVVTQNKKLVPTYYHSNSGGTTEDSANVWNNSLSHIRALKVPYGTTDPAYKWQARFSTAQIIRLLRRGGIKVSLLKNIKVVKKTISGRAYKILLDAHKDYAIRATRLRTLLGENTIRSAKFSISKEGTNYTFSGIGYGHGVGLCQWCAKEMADQGHSFEAIISQFYHNIDMRVYNPSKAG